MVECVFWYSICSIYKNTLTNLSAFLQVASQEAVVCFSFMTELKGEKVPSMKVTQGLKGAVNWFKLTGMQGRRVVTTFVSADARRLLCHTLAARAAGYSPNTHYDGTSGPCVSIQEPQSHSLSKTQVFLRVIACTDTDAVRFYR